MMWRRRRIQPEGSQGQTSGADMHMSLAQLRTALNALPMGVIVVDQDGTEWWRNRAAHVFVDAVSEGRNVRGLLSAMAQRAMRGHAEMVEMPIDGPPSRMVEAKSVTLVNGGALIVLEDITERFLTDRVRTDFVANISHELKTPVGALSILAETIVGEAEANGSDPDLAALARRMVGESHRVGRIIDDLLELASIEFRGTERRGAISMQTVVSEAVARNLAKAESLGITINREIPAEDCEVLGDDRQIESAIANLVENAVKYSERGDTVTVTLSSDEFTAFVEVSDEGIGISPDHVDRVFERFYRVDQARSRQTGGTGLGLAIVRHVVGNHGGEVNVRSTEGEGSTFTLSLPLYKG